MEEASKEELYEYIHNLREKIWKLEDKLEKIKEWAFEGEDARDIILSIQEIIEEEK